jgi:integrase
VPVPPPRSLEEVIAGFSPTSVGAPAAAFARAVVGRAHPASAERAKALLFAAAKLAHFAQRVGLEPAPEMLRDEALIERLILGGSEGLSVSTRRTLRANLRALARALAPPLAPGAVGLPRERARAPYAPEEIARYLALAAAQPTLARRMRSLGLIALGAGAGLMGSDLRSVRGRDVVARSSGLLVVVGGSRSRVVPVLARFHGVLIDSAGFAGEGYVIGSHNPLRHNVTTPLVSSLAGGADLARLDTGRLRASWLRDCAEAIGLSSFMAAAGITCSQRLGDIAAGVAPRSETETVLLLGAGTE